MGNRKCLQYTRFHRKISHYFNLTGARDLDVSQLSKLLDSFVLHAWGAEHTDIRFFGSWAVWAKSER